MEEKQVQLNLLEIKLTIQKAIDKHCKENPNTTYAEVNTALVDILKSNLGYELKEMWQ